MEDSSTHMEIINPSPKNFVEGIFEFFILNGINKLDIDNFDLRVLGAKIFSIKRADILKSARPSNYQMSDVELEDILSQIEHEGRFQLGFDRIGKHEHIIFSPGNPNQRIN